MAHIVTVTDRDPLLDIEAECPCGWTAVRSGTGCRSEIDKLVSEHVRTHVS